MPIKEKELDYFNCAFNPNRQELIDDYFNSASETATMETKIIKAGNALIDFLLNPGVIIMATLFIVFLNY